MVKAKNSDNNSRVQFHALTADIDDVAYAVAQRKGIPSLVAPGEARAGRRPVTPEPVRDDSSQQQQREPQAGRVLKAWCPNYLVNEVLTTAVERNVTVSFLLIEALKSSGFEVAPEDLVPDGRRVRGNAPK